MSSYKNTSLGDSNSDVSILRLPVNGEGATPRFSARNIGALFPAGLALVRSSAFIVVAALLPVTGPPSHTGLQATAFSRGRLVSMILPSPTKRSCRTFRI
jgi:hypothetical protein